MKEKEIKRFNSNKAGGKLPEGEAIQGDGGGDCHMPLPKVPKMCKQWMCLMQVKVYTLLFHGLDRSG